MSVVPYRSSDRGRVVYHDPTSQILVVHDNRENSVELFGSHGFEKELESYRQEPKHISDLVHRSVRHRGRRSVSSNSRECPNCGVDLGNFYGNFSESFKKRSHDSFSSSEEGGRRGSTENGYTDLSGNGGVSEMEGSIKRGQSYPPGLSLDTRKSSHFMHHDYFHLLADLPFDATFPGSTSTNSYDRALEAPILPSENITDPEWTDIFNQGYFQRFFRKIPPGILGSGAHAQVYKVAHVLKDIQLGIFAVKRINVGDHLHFLDQVLNEVLILYELSAKGATENNLIRYNHVWMEYGDLCDSATYILNPSASDTIMKVPYVYILQQYCDGGHLEHLIASNFQRAEHMSEKERVDEERARRRRHKKHDSEDTSDSRKKWLSDLEIWKFFADITNGVAYLHAHGILHRDLKPSNCLLESKYDTSDILQVESPMSETDLDNVVSGLPKVVVSDFGEGKFMDKRQNSDSVFSREEERRGNTGTIEFTDPRMWEFQSVTEHKDRPQFAHKFSFDSDIYSLGMILCYLCVGKLPFSEKIANYSNPTHAREEIAKWHKNLTIGTFSEWYDRKRSLLSGENTSASENFKAMIYSMIKGKAQTPKPSSKLLKKYLESMKWEVFISGRNRSRSEATIVEMGGGQTPQSADETFLSTISGGESAEEIDETINLVDSDGPKDTLKSDNNAPSLLAASVPILTRAIYVFNLIALELFVSSSYSKTALVAKVGNVLCLAGENYLKQEIRAYVAGAWLLLSLWVCL